MILFKDFHWLDASDIRTSSERRPKGKNLELHSLVYRYLAATIESFINYYCIRARKNDFRTCK